MKRYFSIGMAGHIDHGKTTLTEALTGINTDRLKEEKERGLSIEPGFASLINSEHLEVSLIDVPGHERFIRQMIAGVAGIDFVLLIIAADEGMMPQTIEHLNILSLLGIKRGFVVLTKLDKVDDEWLTLVTEDIKNNLRGSFLEGKPIYFVDSVSKKGIDHLKKALLATLEKLPKRQSNKPFRLPIDHVFTVKGQGVIVRGTVYDGTLMQGDDLILLPHQEKVRVRQMQSHRKIYEQITAGQRAALNITGVSHTQISRGHVLVAEDFYAVSKRIDVAFTPLRTVKYPLKQRQLIKLFIGTSEVMGKVIFFDRNVMNTGETEEIVCQIELKENIVVSREDRLILRRPTPAETIGGGWVIEPEAKKHRFGQETIDQLLLKKDGTVEERIHAHLKEHYLLTKDEILRLGAISEEEFLTIQVELLQVNEQYYTLKQIFSKIKDDLKQMLKDFHKQYPLRIGIDKAEVLSQFMNTYPDILLERVIEKLIRQEKIKSKGPFLAIDDFTPHIPAQWKAHLQPVKRDLIAAHIDVPKWSVLNEKHQVADHIQREFYHYLIETGKVYVFDEDRIITKQAVHQAAKTLLKATQGESFTLQTAREVLNLSRKNLIPLLELFDQLKITRRQENVRLWLTESIE